MALVVMKDGRQLVSTTVQLPVELREYAAEHRISMSRLLREALAADKALKEAEA